MSESGVASTALPLAVPLSVPVPVLPPAAPPSPMPADSLGAIPSSTESAAMSPSPSPFSPLQLDNSSHQLIHQSNTPRSEDSGLSTMDSTCSFSLSLHRPIQPSSLAEILLSEHNNNLPSHMDVVKLLRLKASEREEEEEQHSNSSSLETLSSLGKEVGSGDEAECGSDTSCSEDSFEMSSAIEEPLTEEGAINKGPRSLYRNRQSRETTCESFTSAESECSLEPNSDEAAAGAEETALHLPICPPRASISMDSFIPQAGTSKDLIRQNIYREVDALDTGLPQLDFENLARKLATAAKEQKESERRLLGEEVRRRLALKFDACEGPSLPAATRPGRSNLAARLQNAMNLQVCYLNDLAESSNAETESESEDEERLHVPKSKSAPNLKAACRRAAAPLENPQVQRLRLRAKEGGKLDPYERQRLLHGETQRMVRAAKSKAESQVDEYRRNRSKASVVPRQARHYLSKMSTAQIEQIRDVIEDAIARKNIELVQLLMSRDNLCMEHDSLLVDIDDFTEHDAQADALDFHTFLLMQDGDLPPAPSRTLISNHPPARPAASPISLPLPTATTLTSSPAPSSKHSAPTPLTSPVSPSSITSFIPLPTIALPKSFTNRFGISKLL